jgi:MFS family permease
MRPPSLLSRAHLPFTVGAVALVTLGAFENRATMTVLPSVAQDLDGLWLFGAAAAAPLISYVVSTAAGGVWSDRRGPVPTLYAGMLLFVVSQLALGLAPSMPVFVLGRVGSGLAEGLLDIGLTVLLARTLPESLRAKVFAAFAAAWVLPSLLGPSIAGGLAQATSWRAVFLLGAALLIPAALLLRPSMAAAAAGAGTAATPPHPSRDQRRAIASALAVAVTLAVLTAGGSFVSDPGWTGVSGAALVVVAIAALVPLLGTLVPAGTARLAHGIPAVVALRGLVSAAFGTAGALIPLMLTAVHGFRPAAAGASLTITGLCWAAGSQLHGLSAVQARWSAPMRLRLGFALIAVGVLGPALTALHLLPVWAGLAAWGLAGIGMGITSPTLATQMLALSPVADQGRNTAAASLAGSVTQAVALAVVGAGIAWQAPSLPGWLFAAGMGGGSAIGLMGLVGARRAG